MYLEPFYYKFSDSEIIYLTDSIVSLMKELDFKDSEAPFLDGIFTEILFVFKNGSVQKAQLSNSKTLYQGKLLDFMINSIINNCKTNDNVLYVKILRDYYN